MIPTSKVCSIISDGGSDARKAASDFKKSTPGMGAFLCINHQLHNTVLRSLASLKQALGKFFDFVSMLNRSNKATQTFRSIQEKVMSTKLNLLEQSNTRWSGIFMLLSRFLRLQTAVEAYCGADVAGKTDILPDFKLASQLVSLLSPVHEISTNLQATGMSHVPLCILELLRLRKLLKHDGSMLAPVNRATPEKLRFGGDILSVEKIPKRDQLQEISHVRRALLAEVQIRFFGSNATSTIRSKGNLLELVHIQAIMFLFPNWEEQGGEFRFKARKLLEAHEHEFLSHDQCLKSFLEIHEHMHRENSSSASSATASSEVEVVGDDDDEEGDVVLLAHRSLGSFLESETKPCETESSAKLNSVSAVVEARTKLSNDATLMKKWNHALELHGKPRMDLADTFPSMMLSSLNNTEYRRTCLALFSTLVTTAPCERVFSKAGLEGESHCLSKAPVTMHERIFCRVNTLPDTQDILNNNPMASKGSKSTVSDSPGALHIAEDEDDETEADIERKKEEEHSKNCGKPRKRNQFWDELALNALMSIGEPFEPAVTPPPAVSTSINELGSFYDLFTTEDGDGDDEK